MRATCKHWIGSSQYWSTVVTASETVAASTNAASKRSNPPTMEGLFPSKGCAAKGTKISATFAASITPPDSAQ